MPDPSQLNIASAFGLDKFNIGAGTLGNIAIVLVIGFLILGLFGAILFIWYRNKQYKLRIPLYSLVGNKPTRIGTYKARVLSIGTAGDRLWYVKGAKKYLPPGTIQSAPNEFMYWVREDGEWINFSIADLDKTSKEAKVKFIQQDMRMARLATERLLEQRLMKKNFWEKYGIMIGYVIFFLIITVSLAIIFYLWGDIVDKIGVLVDRLDSIILRENTPSGAGGLVPVSIALLFYKKKEMKKIGLMKSDKTSTLPGDNPTEDLI